MKPYQSANSLRFAYYLISWPTDSVSYDLISLIIAPPIVRRNSLQIEYCR